jgi:GNAT superfamily N-acetyltransferase
MPTETRAAAVLYTKELATTVRTYADRDFDEVVARWHQTNLVSYWYVELHQKHTLAEARAFFRDHVYPSCRIFIAERETRLAGLLALEAPWIRQFAVFPEYQRSGVGTALLSKARDASSSELRLFTFRRNKSARAFYEKHGFTAVAFGISPAPESEPDVEYRWTA